MSQAERKAAQAAAQLEAARKFEEERKALSCREIAFWVSDLFPGVNPYQDFRFAPFAFIQYTGRWPNGEPCTDRAYLRAKQIIGG